ncbi:MAG: hypothetical protein R6U26_03110 [Candidatus Undinarchaeales archaeon]
MKEIISFSVCEYKFSPNNKPEVFEIENGDLKLLFDKINREIKQNSKKWVKNYLLKR